MKKVRWTALALVVLACLGCSPNPAGPPAPPAELPAALRFPARIEISATKIASPSLGTGDLADEIGQGGFFATTVGDFVDAVLGRLASFDIPVSDTTTTFRASVDADGDGSLDDLKIDFSPYTFDTFGRGEDCSGHTAAFPICYRIWLDGKPLIAGIFEDQFPSAAVVGAGRFKFGDRATEFLGVGVVYDHTAAPSKTNEYFLLNDSSQPAAPPSFFDNLHVLFDQEGEDARARKTIHLSSLANPGNTQPAGLFQYIGRWLENNDFWSGSIHDERGVFTDFTNLCARISTASAADLLNCNDLGISVGSPPDFIELAAPGEAGLPADFPPAPTF